VVPPDRAAPVTTQAVCKSIAPVRRRLSNGVVLLAHESHAVPTVALNATFQAGSAQDPCTLPGVAYLTRRTIDRGTPARSADDIAATLDDRGVSLRTSLSRHTFSLSCVCLPEDFDEILGLLADIARQAEFPELELEKARLEAITSVHEDEDDPSRVVLDTIAELLYGSRHPYGRRFKGSVADLEAITRAHLLGYQRDHLRSPNLRLAIAGSVPAPAALDAAQRALDDWNGAPAGEHDIPPAAARSGRIVQVREMAGKSQSEIAYGFLTVSRTDPRYHAYWIMNNILGQFGIGGRLAENLRERQGMAYYAGSTLEAAPGDAPLLIQAGVDPLNVERALAAIDSEVTLLGRSGPTLDEVEETRDSLIGSIPRMLETNEGIAEFLLTVEQFGLGVDYDRRLPGLLHAVTLDDVRQAAAAVLDPARAAVAVAGPHS
jgi:zinc protease